MVSNLFIADITRLGGDLTSFTKLMKSLNLSQFLQKNKK